MNKREIVLLGLLYVAFCSIAILIGHYWLELVGSKFMIYVLNVTSYSFFWAVMVYIGVGIKRTIIDRRHHTHFKAVLLFWGFEYARNPIMEDGGRIPVDHLLILLILISDPEYSEDYDLPDIGNHQLNRYYTSMYLRVVDKIGLPCGMDYQAFTRRLATHLQKKLNYPKIKQSGDGIAKCIGEMRGYHFNKQD